MALPAVPREQVNLNEELQWVRKPVVVDHSPYEGYVQPETFREKAYRKTSANPMVPIGVIATTCALGYGLYAMRTGNSALSQRMMRARVTAQGFTIVALVLGVMLAGKRAK